MTEQTMDTSDCAAMGTTTEHHKKLTPFEGTFKSVVKMWMGPGEPSVMTGVIKNTFDLEGRFLHQSYESDPSTDGPFSNFAGRGYWGYNTVTNEYEGFWIDTACTFMQHERGQVDGAGKVWTMTGTMPNPQTGGTMTKKSVITLKDRDHHSLEMYFDGPDGNEFKAMEIQYTRA
ncbi:MAG: DUF1579 domain-containing protein [Phycisphaerae bacterium]|nr:DUF1579 domain-containing protein [Phycisphaerae bacterium]